MAYPTIHAIIHYGAETFYAFDDGDISAHLERLVKEGKIKETVHLFVHQATLYFDQEKGMWQRHQQE